MKNLIKEYIKENELKNIWGAIQENDYIYLASDKKVYMFRIGDTSLKKEFNTNNLHYKRNGENYIISLNNNKVIVEKDIKKSFEPLLEEEKEEILKSSKFIILNKKES